MRGRVLVVGVAVAALLVMGGSWAGAQAEHVTICHRTGSASNPYVRIAPSASGVYHGHLDHEQVGNGLGGDIIPPFAYQGATYSKNWGSHGQAIFANGCQVPAKPSPDDGDKTPPPPTKTVPPGIAFTGPNGWAIALGLTALALLLAGFGLVYIGHHRSLRGR